MSPARIHALEKNRDVESPPVPPDVKFLALDRPWLPVSDSITIDPNPYEWVDENFVDYYYDDADDDDKESVDNESTRNAPPLTGSYRIWGWNYTTTLPKKGKMQSPFLTITVDLMILHSTSSFLFMKVNTIPTSQY